MTRATCRLSGRIFGDSSAEEVYPGSTKRSPGTGRLEYIARGVFAARTAGDALHVAIAVSHGIGYLGSWNFKHLVRVATRREVNLVNALHGYQPIEIVAPPEL